MRGVGRGRVVAGAVALVVLLAGCGGGNGGSEGAESATVSVASVDGVGDVLVDDEGAALYAADEEGDGTVRCVDGCAAIWLPLTVEGEPVGEDELDGELSVVERPDGDRQVAFAGLPLYSFIEDTSAGAVTGNGLSDEFAGKEFTWHVLTPDGPSTTDANSEKPADGKEPYSGGGYGR
jgi:predicted lipoprotein with Yx(FWY)xxD motif